MKPIAAVSLLALALTACGGPRDEDVLTDEKISASQSAPELPDIELSENPEPPPAPPPPVETPLTNELENAVEADPLAPVASSGPIPAAFQARWGTRPADCRAGDVVGSGLTIGGDTLMSAESVGRLQEVVADEPGRFIGLFEYDGIAREEQLVLTGSSNTLIRIAGNQRYAYRRCDAARPTG